MLAAFFFSFGIVTTAVLQLLTIFYVGLMDYQPYTSSFTQVGTTEMLQRYRVKASRLLTLWFVVQIGVFAKSQLVPFSDKTSTINLTSDLPLTVTTGMSLNDCTPLLQ